MIGLVRSTSSPCSSSIRRSTPWVDGCCGPMLSSIVCSSASGASWDSVAASVSDSRSTEPSSRSSSAAVAPLRGPISWVPSPVRRGRRLGTLGRLSDRPSAGNALC